MGFHNAENKSQNVTHSQTTSYTPNRYRRVRYTYLVSMLGIDVLVYLMSHQYAGSRVEIVAQVSVYTSTGSPRFIFHDELYSPDTYRTFHIQKLLLNMSQKS